jgi:hypothetical protein
MLQTVVNLALQIQRDEQCDERTLRQRDRHLGKSFSHLSTKPWRQLTAWLSRVSVAEDRRKALHAARALQMVTMALFLLGSATGSGAAAAAFYYDGRHPINILPVLALFVLLPVLMLLSFGVTALSRSWVVKWPIVAGVQESFTMMLVGVMSAVTRVLPQPYREALQQTAGRTKAYRRVYGHMQKWILLKWWQTFALAFMLGALAWFGYRLVVTDLAFTWSTTLQSEQPEVLYARVQGLTNALAAPWATFWPQANPSMQLIRETHYFRLQEGMLPDHVAPAVLGGWWPFLVMSMVVYGLLPRLLTWSFCTWRYRVASRWCLLHTPGAAEVLDRLNSTMIETRSATSEAMGAQPTPVAAEVPIDQGVAAAVSQAFAINWSAVPVDDERLHQLLSDGFALKVLHLLHAGGRNTLAADAEVIAQISQFSREGRAGAGLRPPQVVMLVKAWEPPMLEVVDFLRELRHAIDAGVRILVVALWIPLGDGVREADVALYVDQWQRKLTTIGDPWLKVRSLTLDTPALQDRVDVLAQHDNQEMADA